MPTSPPSSGGYSAKRLRNKLLRRLLVAGQRVGLDITPHHFYSNVPDISALKEQRQWRSPRSMAGVNGADVDDQVRFLSSCLTDEVSSELRSRDIYEAACVANGAVGYGPVEAQILYGFIARNRPRRVVQVGSGVSTAVILEAATACEIDISLVCIDPFPTDYLRARAQAGEIRLIASPAQGVALDEFTDLVDGDLLFVDSTHTVKPGSEVNRLILEVLPRLSPGVFVHLHDIYFPYDYGRDLLTDDLFFWNESVLLHAFLINNAKATIRLSCSMLHHARTADLASIIPRYSPQPMDDGLALDGRVSGDCPSATYLQIIG